LDPSSISTLLKVPLRPRPWIVCILLAVAIAALYGPALSVPFIFDDIDTIVHNESIVTIWPLVGTSAHRGPFNPRPDLPTTARPLVNLSFAISHQFSQLNPTGYHLASALIHFLSAVLLWALVRRTLCLPYFAGRFDAAAGWLALSVSTLWALHPLQTETVIYATQRTELMMALFYLATLYCSLRYWTVDGPRSQPQRLLWLAAAAVSCLAGMMSKEVMVSAPLIVLLYDRAFISGSLFGAVRKSWPLYAALAATWIVLVLLSVGSPHGSAAGFHLGPPIYVWWFTQTKILWLYLKLAIWPSPLLIHYQLPYVSIPFEACLYVVPLLLLGIGTLWLLWRNHPVGFLGACVFAILAPTSVIPIITEMAAERRMYLPLAALATLFVVGAYQLAQHVATRKPNHRKPSSAFRPWTIAVPTLALAILCSAAIAKRLQVYKTPTELWQQVLYYQPENDTAHSALGKYLEIAGDIDGAALHFRESLRLRPDLPMAHFDYGMMLFKQHAFREAAAEYAEARKLSPNDEGISANLALALYFAGRYDEALVAVRDAIRLAPGQWSFHNNEGMILTNLGRHQEAIESYERALQRNPQAIDLYHEIAHNYFKLNQPEKAKAALERGLDQATAYGDSARAEKFATRLRENN
jgi:protein O-mannosyl-transferase